MHEDESYWRAVRAAFALDPGFVHLVGFWLSSHPAPVREAIGFHRRELDSNPYLYVRNNEEREESKVRSALGRFLKGNEDCFALTESTSLGLGLITAGLEGSSADELLTTEHEHYSAWESAEGLSLRCGMRLRRALLYNDDEEPTKELIVQRLLDSLSDTTRIVLLTWVHSSTGVRLPLPDMCREIKARFIGRSRPPIIIVDATHAVGAFPLSLDESYCDIVVGSCHKWMLAPRGTAFVWGREEALASIRPAVASFASGALGRFTGAREIPALLPGERLTPGGFHCFEHRWAVPAAIEFIENIGVERVASRIAHLCNLLRQGLEEIEGIRVVTPRSHSLSAGFVCFEVLRREAYSVCRDLLGDRILCSAGPYRKSLCRFSPFVYNSFDDIERALDAVRKVVAMGD